MILKIYNPDLTFKIYIIENYSSISKIEIINNQNLSIKEDEVLILAPQNNLLVDDEVFNNIPKNNIIFNFENNLPEHLHKYFNVINFKMSTSVATVKKQILELSEAFNYKQYQHFTGKRMIDHDISRGFIHDINNKLFPPLTVVSSIENMLNSESGEINTEKLLRLSKMAKKSLNEIQSKALSYRNLFLTLKEVQNETSSNIYETYNTLSSLIKYKASKAQVSFTPLQVDEKLKEITYRANPILLLQFLISICTSFLDHKRKNIDFSLDSLELTHKQDSDKIALIVELRSNNGIKDLLAHTESDDFKNIMIQHKEVLEHIGKYKFRLLDVDGVLTFYIELQKK